MDEDWLALCQAIYKGVEGPERENMHCKVREAAQSGQPLKKPECFAVCRVCCSACALSPEGWGCNSKKTEVLGDLYRYCK